MSSYSALEMIMYAKTKNKALKDMFLLEDRRGGNVKIEPESCFSWTLEAIAVWCKQYKKACVPRHPVGYAWIQDFVWRK